LLLSFIFYLLSFIFYLLSFIVMSSDAAARNRVYWQCRRGMRELDVLLFGFLERGYDQLDDQQRQNFEQLLGCPDALLLEYLMGRTVPRDAQTAELVKRIRESARTT
jgi:antitoxin CptB